jgi:hypothetical protein
MGSPANPDNEGKYVNFLCRFPVRERVRDHRVSFLPKEVNIGLSLGIFSEEIFKSHFFIND